MAEKSKGKQAFGGKKATPFVKGGGKAKAPSKTSKPAPKKK